MTNFLVIVQCGLLNIKGGKLPITERRFFMNKSQNYISNTPPSTPILIAAVKSVLLGSCLATKNYEDLYISEQRVVVEMINEVARVGICIG